ncbi:hypothetical protein ACN38_g1268 [Penicillium nordicum]|uniref:Uncharacterized protein n=1 Tax=Penicillium nordicum TaxID=229535 RepID=A0A0M8PBX3_9EURO|nr:hypothetical protein ACN38_g1268 [Penicillium nordicum]
MRPIAVISDDHLEMLTRVRVRACLRAEARQRIFAEAFFIMQTLQDIMGQPYPHQLPMGTLLQDLEHHMQDLLEDMVLDFILCNLTLTTLNSINISHYTMHFDVHHVDLS